VIGRAFPAVCRGVYHDVFTSRPAAAIALIVLPLAGHPSAMYFAAC